MFYHGKSSLNHHFGNIFNLFQQYKQIQAQNSSSKIAQPECKHAPFLRVCLQVLPIHMCCPNAALCHKDAYITVDATFSIYSKCCFWSLWIVNTDKKQHWTAINIWCLNKMMKLLAAVVIVRKFWLNLSSIPLLQRLWMRRRQHWVKQPRPLRHPMIAGVDGLLNF